MDGRSVLVVEDDPGIRTLVVELLTEAGYGVLEASRGTGGCTSLRSGCRQLSS
jgi:CheY-like chemotaxis protein